MLQRFKRFIAKYDLIDPEDKVLVGFSAGPDSVALAHLFSRIGIEFALAHFNFKLRGKDSDLDQQFAEDFAKKLNVEIFVTSADTRKYAQRNKLSIEMAARQLRYDWFNTIAKDKNFTKIATAHNADDLIETVLINLSRSSGIRGLAGIPPKAGKIIRPLLFAFKDQILSYCKKNNLDFRIDKTNFQTDYYRNKIRHLIVPKFEQINPSFKQNVFYSALYLRSSLQIIERYVFSQIKDLVKTDANRVYIDREVLVSHPYKDLLLFEIISQYGFSPKQIDQILISLTHQPGKIFYSKSYRLLIDRKFLILERLATNYEPVYYRIDTETRAVEFDDCRLELEFVNPKEINLKVSSNIGLFDVDKVHFPLIVRNWQAGDWFIPFGFKGRKKISDFLRQLKVDRFEKEKIKILQDSTGKIIWVIGYRTDERTKINSNTKKVLKITMICR